MNIKTFLRLNVLLLVFCFSLIAFSSSVFARSGCCSYHGGVCGCGCCDGTGLSSTCAPYYPECNRQVTNYVPPVQPTPILFPTNTNANWNFTPNTNGTFNVTIKLDDSPSTQYSAVLNKCKGCDPGPNSDFFANSFYYQNVKPGIWYLNVKKEVGGYWSNTVYWTVPVPAWYSPSPTPIPTIRQTPTITPNNESNDSGMGILSFLGLGALGYGGYKFIVKPTIDANKT